MYLLGTFQNGEKNPVVGVLINVMAKSVGRVHHVSLAGIHTLDGTFLFNVR